MSTVQMIVYAAILLLVAAATVVGVIKVRNARYYREAKRLATESLEASAKEMQSCWYTSPNKRVRVHVVNQRIVEVVVADMDYPSVYNAKKNEAFSKEELEFLTNLDKVTKDAAEFIEVDGHKPKAFEGLSTLLDGRLFIYKSTSEEQTFKHVRKNGGKVKVEIVAEPVPKGKDHLPKLRIINAWIEGVGNPAENIAPYRYKFNIDRSKDDNQYFEFKYVLSDRKELAEDDSWFATLEKRINTYNQSHEKIREVESGYELTPDVKVPKEFIDKLKQELGEGEDQAEKAAKELVHEQIEQQKQEQAVPESNQGVEAGR